MARLAGLGLILFACVGSTIAVKFQTSQVRPTMDLLASLGYSRSLATKDCNFFYTSLPTLRVSCDRYGYLTTISVGFKSTLGTYAYANMSALPNSLPQFVRLTSLSFLNVAVRSPLPICLGNISSLQILSFQQVSVPGKLPASIGNLARLKDFVFQGWAPQPNLPLPSGPIPSTYTRLASLVNFDVSFSRFNGSLPAFGCVQSRLKKFVRGLPPGRALASGQFEGTIPNTYSGLTALTELTLNSNLLGGPLPDFITLQKLPNLKTLVLRDNYFTGRADGYCASLGDTYDANCLSAASLCFKGVGFNTQRDPEFCDAFCHAGVYSSPRPACAGHGTCLPVATQPGRFYCVCDRPYKPDPKDLLNCMLPVKRRLVLA